MILSLVNIDVAIEHISILGPKDLCYYISTWNIVSNYYDIISS